MSTNVSGFFSRSLRYVHATLGSGLLLFLLLLLVNAYAFTPFTVHGTSMFPTLHDGQILPVSLLSYQVATPQKWDVVIVAYAGDEGVHFVKRIVGIPGEQVPYQGQTITLGPDQYFVAGDNRPHSTDSRVYGPITRSQLVGKVLGQDHKRDLPAL
jgi:signal peptidase I